MLHLLEDLVTISKNFVVNQPILPNHFFFLISTPQQDTTYPRVRTFGRVVLVSAFMNVFGAVSCDISWGRLHAAVFGICICPCTPTLSLVRRAWPAEKTQQSVILFPSKSQHIFACYRVSVIYATLAFLYLVIVSCVPCVLVAQIEC
jgi:hypothetical protein